MNGEEKTINFVISLRNREAKSAYSISAARDDGFVMDCDPTSTTIHRTNLTRCLEEIIKDAGIDRGRFNRSTPIQLKCGDKSLPPIVMNDRSTIRETMRNLSSDMGKLYNKASGGFFFCPKLFEIGMYQQRLKSVYVHSGEENMPVSYSRVFLDCSGHLIPEGPSILKESIENIKQDFKDFRVILHYVLRIQEVAGQEYYKENLLEERKFNLKLCIRKDMRERLEMPSNKEFGKQDSKTPPDEACENNSCSLIGLVDGIVLVFNVYNEKEGLRDKVLGNMLKNDLIKISNSLGVSKLRKILLMKKCEKLLEGSKNVHERIYDYLVASIDEFPNKCLEQIGE